MEGGGSAWLERCRDAVVSVVDGFAWELAVEQPRLERRLTDGGWALVRGERLEEAVQLADAATLALGDTSVAEVAGRRALELDPTLVRAYRVVCRALVRQGRLDDAIAFARAGLEVDPENGGLYAQLGAMLLRSGDLDGAEAAAAEAERRGPNARATRKLRGDIKSAREGRSEGRRARRFKSAQ